MGHPTQTETEVIQKTVEAVSEPNVFEKKKPTISTEYQFTLVWRNIIAFSIAYVILIMELYNFFFKIDWATHMFVWFLVLFSGMGVTAGAHRLWAHKSYKAKTPLRLLLAIGNATAHMMSIYDFVRDHRTHHKFVDTDADPHNSKRGFFFSHIGWLCVRKHKEVNEKGKLIDMSDLEADWVVMWQRKYFYEILMPLCGFIIPTLIPWYFWGLGLGQSFRMCGLMRWFAVVNGAFFVNSAAHIWGYQPYDSSTSAKQNPYVSFWAFGEGWHNYHHVFPWDYKTSEAPYFLNISTAFIDFFAWLGLAYDLKTVEPEKVSKRALRTGDGSHRTGQGNGESNHHKHENEIWGWDDKDLTTKHRVMATITHTQ